MSRRGPLVLAIAAGWLVLDQLTKWLALNNADPCFTDPDPFFWTLRFCTTSHTGGAFSLLDGLGPLIAVAAIFIVIFLFRVGRAV